MGKWKDADEYANEVEVTAVKVLKIIGFTILGIGFVILVGFVVRWLWNWLMVDIFSLKEITYWQGIGILVLGRILFGGFGGSGSSSKDEKKSVRGVIGREIHDEMQKEFKAEYARKYGTLSEDSYQANEATCEKTSDLQPENDLAINPSSKSNNQTEDDLYEAWWKAEGEKKFEDYMRNR